VSLLTNGCFSENGTAEQFIMSCNQCGSDNQAEFPTEMIVHFTGLKHLDKAGVSLFPKVLMCLDCGSSRFSVPHEKLAVLGSGAPKSDLSVA
jgi:hypothetical protein